MIKVYTTPTCIYCHALMNWLNEEGIDFQEIDANTVPGITAVPVTVITDKDNKNPIQIIGFDRDSITETIEKYGLRTK
ncbi:glutaredoxin family protein [Candidatus Saccharibacteria bacterium]|jgi:glutaredoxin|nr:glutaredoxin family protein [Candidatus Saccharibacteria bacterium]MBB1532367.1 glutaredoxin family protein [Candidatus Saccharibacteria bacterium]MBF1037293.1 glutaredoxin family protein [Candidatus Nanosynbacter sp.]